MTLVEASRRKQKAAPSLGLGAAFQEDPTVVLLSHRGSSAVPSPKWGLTSVFGMGTGVAPTLWTVGKPGSTKIHENYQLPFSWPSAVLPRS